MIVPPEDVAAPVLTADNVSNKRMPNGKGTPLKFVTTTGMDPGVQHCRRLTVWLRHRFPSRYNVGLLGVHLARIAKQYPLWWTMLSTVM